MSVEVRVTLDTNILIYAVDKDGGAKNGRAREVVGAVARADSFLTLQVLGEFFHATTRKGLLDHSKSQAFIGGWRAVFPVVPANEASLAAAMELVRLHSFSFWDAMLWATARRAGCTHIISENMQHLRVLEGVTIVEPFAAKVPDVLRGLL